MYEQTLQARTVSQAGSLGARHYKDLIERRQVRRARTFLLRMQFGAGGCAPRGQSQLRSFARYALLPAPSPCDELDRRRTARTDDASRWSQPKSATGKKRFGGESDGRSHVSRAVQLVAGGRGGKERAASLRAQLRLAPGGAAPCTESRLTNVRADPEDLRSANRIQLLK